MAVIRRPATAKRYAVPYLVGFTILGFYRYSSSHPQWSGAAQRWVFNHTNRRRELLFDYLSRLLVLYDQPPCWTVVSFTYDQLSGLWVIRLFDQTPNLSSRITESGEGT
jgi:hypothetical protein